MIQARENLISELNRGDKAAFMTVYDTLYPTVYYYVKKVLSEEEAPDICSEVFIKLWESRSKFESIEHIRNWVKVTSRNACFKKFRKYEHEQKYMREALHKYDNIQLMWLDKETADMRTAYLKKIYDLIDPLPQQKREVFKLAFIEGLKNPEIAAILNVNEKKVKNIKSWIINFLRNRLTDKKGAAIFSVILYAVQGSFTSTSRFF